MHRREHRILSLILAAVILSTVTTVLCRAVAGISLGTFFGTVAFTTLLAPPLAAAADTMRQRLATPLAVSQTAALVWLSAIGSLFTPAQWFSCNLVLLCYALGLAGLCSLARSLRITTFLASTTITIFAMLWLTWPVWLSRALLHPRGESLAAWLVPAHPLFAINRVLAHFDTWDRYPIAYSELTVLNQDVFYTLPTTIAWTTLLHGTIAAITFSIAWRVESSRLRAASAPAASPAVPGPERLVK